VLCAAAVLIACACSQPAARSDRPARSATDRTRAADALIMPELVRRLELGISIGEARARWPALFTLQGAHDPALDVIVRRIPSTIAEPNDQEPFTGVEIELRSPAQRERVLASWGRPVVGDKRYGTPLRAYAVPAARLRALALAEPGSDPRCHTYNGAFTNCTIRIDEHWPLESHLELWGLQGSASLLHASEAELVQRFGARYQRVEPSRTFLTMPGLGTETTLTTDLTFHHERVQAAVVALAFSSAGIDDAAVLRLARERFGAAGEGLYGELLFGRGDPRLAIRLHEGSIHSLELRDLAKCPTESVRIAEWMQARTREAPGSVVSLIHQPPFTLVRERAAGPHGCTETFRELDFPGAACDLGVAETSTLATDCCDGACSADPVAWTLRLEDAVARKDLAAVRAMLPADRPVPVSYHNGTDDSAETRSWTLTRSDTPLEALEIMFDDGYSPRCPPEEYLLDDGSSSSSGEIVCLVGDGVTCGALFRWTGDARQLYLESVTFHCC
jgi:hypothetical protein